MRQETIDRIRKFTADREWEQYHTHGKPVIYRVNCCQMVQDGFRFFLSANKVWLTKEVPARYLTKLG